MGSATEGEWGGKSYKKRREKKPLLSEKKRAFRRGQNNQRKRIRIKGPIVSEEGGKKWKIRREPRIRGRNVNHVFVEGRSHQRGGGMLKCWFLGLRRKGKRRRFSSEGRNSSAKRGGGGPRREEGGWGRLVCNTGFLGEGGHQKKKKVQMIFQKRGRQWGKLMNKDRKETNTRFGGGGGKGHRGERP